MRRRSAKISSLAFGVLLAILSEPAEASPPASAFLDVRFVDPPFGSIQTRAGWRLSLEVTVKDGASDFFPDFPTYGRASRIILRDVDECLKGFEQGCPAPSCPVGTSNPSCIPDITLLVRPDSDLPGLTDSRGYISPVQVVGNAISFGSAGAPVGPQPARADGVDYGFNDDFPGLVVLSSVGAGRLLEAVVTARDGAGNPTDYALQDAQPLARRNLAGLMTDVDFELRSRPLPLRPVSRVGVSMTVPPFLFARYRLVDRCVTDPADTSTCIVEGLTERVEPLAVPSFFARWVFPGVDIDSSDNAIVRLTAFVVEGTAPGVLIDCDGDGDVDVSDARCAGYRVLSRIGRASFATTENHQCSDIEASETPWTLEKSEILVDLDGNGQTSFAESCGEAGGGGGGGATRRRSPPM